jgi:hypothetical protein
MGSSLSFFSVISQKFLHQFLFTNGMKAVNLPIGGARETWRRAGHQKHNYQIK